MKLAIFILITYSYNVLLICCNNEVNNNQQDLFNLLSKTNNINFSNKEELSEENTINNLITYLKRVSVSMDNKKEKYTKLIPPSNYNHKESQRNEEDESIYIKDFSYNDLISNMENIKNDLNKVLKENLSNLKSQITPVEGKNIDMQMKNKILISQISNKQKDLEETKNNLHVISDKKDIVKSETDYKSKYYKDYIIEVDKKTETIKNSINAMSNLPLNHTNLDSYKIKFEKEFDQLKELSNLNLKTIEMKEKIKNFLYELDNKAFNNRKDNKENKLKSKTIKDYVDANKIRNNDSDKIRDLVSILEEDKLKELEMFNITSLRSLFMNNNTNIGQYNDLNNFLSEKKNNFSLNKIVKKQSQIDDSKRRLNELRRNHKERIDKLRNIKQNTEKLNQIKISYKKILGDERKKSSVMINKIRILEKNLDSKKKDIRNKEKSRLSLIDKLQEKVNSKNPIINKRIKMIDDVEKKLNKFNDLFRHENLVLKNNKLSIK